MPSFDLETGVFSCNFGVPIGRQTPLCTKTR